MVFGSSIRMLGKKKDEDIVFQFVERPNMFCCQMYRQAWDSAVTSLMQVVLVASEYLKNWRHVQLLSKGFVKYSHGQEPQWQRVIVESDVAFAIHSLTSPRSWDHNASPLIVDALSMDLRSSLLWLCSGDFNDLCLRDEKEGGATLPDYFIQGFRQALEDNNFIQIPIVGSFFTWEKGRESNNLIREKLDRALATEDWTRKFTNVVCSIVHIPRSDHKPLVINTAPKDNRGDRRRFRFDNPWLCNEGLAEVVKGAWVNFIPHNLLIKHDDLVSALSLWGRSRNREFWQKNKTIQRLLDNGPSNVSHASLKEDWNCLLEQEEARLKQQAKCFYDTDQKKSIFYGGSMNCEWVFELALALINDVDNVDLCAPFSNEEFRAALFQMHPDKAPGLDGTFPSSLTETLIVLIPKVDSPETVKDFCPIALCNVLYNIVAKALANRFKRVLSMITSENQSAFIPHRSITNNVIIAFEMIHNMKINKGINDGNYALKIDISKAYDMVQWEFLKGKLEQFSFSTQWIRWLTIYFSKVSYNINFNGDWIGPIVPGRGLRQGILFPRISIWCVRKAYHYYLKMLNLGAAASGQVVNFNKSSIFFSPNMVSSVRVFKAKYFPNGDLFSTNVSNGTGFVWKNVMTSRELIRKGTRWRVGNGEKILVVLAPWIPKEVTFFADDDPDFIEPHLRVYNLFEGNGRVWNIALLMKLFSSRDIRASISIPISITNKKYSFLWHFDKRGEVRILRVYGLARKIIF
ncbi:uncharacterized protein LOC122724655 [Manihot esculenta]|uniref:uncharacterized protein LOC122724655 n=1 Tax=Manihot esculenta TaxID=3983 RepID=UPI001CC4D4D4|nr:uncharacterized protein LOC122724655 [Manihot esculenta]